jgi:hypothetical protein
MIGAKPKIRNITKNGAVNRYPQRPFREGTALMLFTFLCGFAGFHGEGGLLARALTTVVCDILIFR